MIQAHIPDHVLDDARDRQKTVAPELTEAEARRIARGLREGIDHLPEKEYREQLHERLRAFAAAQDVDLPTPDTRSTFWSYQLADHPQINMEPGEELYSMHMAAAYTEAQNSIVEDTLRYLEGTPGGEALSQLHLWDAEMQDALELDEKAGLALAYDAWGTLSEKYAAKTENEALFFMAELNPGTVAYQTESRQLRQDGKLDIIQFMYPAPAAEVRGSRPGDTGVAGFPNRPRPGPHLLVRRERREVHATDQGGPPGPEATRGAPHSRGSACGSPRGVCPSGNHGRPRTSGRRGDAP